MNLGTNAWHAMRDSQGALRVALERCVVSERTGEQLRLKPGVYALVTVTDTGCGMAPATMLRIFEPFFTTKPVGEGTGLGLAVVRGIMEGHDGAVAVESQPGVGTTFRLYFPEFAGALAATRAARGPTPRGGGESVLVVDDEEMLARLCQETLSALGYEVEYTTRPADALSMVTSDPGRFRVVITDQTMPGMSGLFLARELRKASPGLLIMLMSGYTTSLTAERLQAVGVSRLLLKPVSIHSLGTAVNAAVVSRGSGKRLLEFAVQ